MPNRLADSIRAAQLIAELSYRPGPTDPDRILEVASDLIPNFRWRGAVFSRAYSTITSVITFQHIRGWDLPRDDWVMCIAGIDSVTRGAQFFRGYLDDAAMRERHGLNFNSWSDAGMIQDLHWSEPWATRRNVHVFGHSAGGVGAEAWNTRFGSLAANRCVELVTFGAPKPGYSSATRSATDLSRSRYMAYGDPVPMIPTMTLGHAGYIALVVVNRAQSGDFNPELYNCVHGSGGRRIGERTNFAANEPDVGPQPANQLHDWVEGREPAAHRHSIQNYIRQLDSLERVLSRPKAPPIGAAAAAAAELPDDPGALAAIADFIRAAGHELELTAPAAGGADLLAGGPQPPPAQANRFVNPMGLPGVPPGAIRVGERRNGVARLVDGPVIGSSSFPGAAMSMSRLRPGLQFRKVKVGTQWRVQWMDRIVANCTSQSKAHTLAKWGNKWLRVMGNGSTIHNVSMGASLADWFNMASQALGGNPVDVLIDGQ